jgi:nitrate reductase gamma subunit
MVSPLARRTSLPKDVLLPSLLLALLLSGVAWFFAANDFVYQLVVTNDRDLATAAVLLFQYLRLVHFQTTSLVLSACFPALNCLIPDPRSLIPALKAH